MPSSDPANILRLQNKFLKCLLSTKAPAIAGIMAYSVFSDQEQHKQDQQSYIVGPNPDNNPNIIIPALSGSLYNEIKKCLDKFLPDAYKDGHFFALKELGKEKKIGAYLDMRMNRVFNFSNDVIKSSLLNLVSRLYTYAQLGRKFNRTEISKELEKSYSNIVRTESMRNKVYGAIDTLEDAGIKRIVIKAEYRTAGDNHVCPICQAYERKIISIEEARDLIPQHPNCRCWFSVIEAPIER